MWQAKIFKDLFRSLFNQVLKNLCSLAQFIHVWKILANELGNFHWVTLKERLMLTVNLHGSERINTTNDHGLQGVFLEAAKIEPVRPCFMKGFIEPANFRNDLDLTGILIISVDAENYT